jgi:hypothetical protein
LIAVSFKQVTAGRRMRVGEGGYRLSDSGEGDLGESNSTIRVLREVNAERQVTITSGEMYPE